MVIEVIFTQIEVATEEVHLFRLDALVNLCTITQQVSRLISYSLIEGYV